MNTRLEMIKNKEVARFRLPAQHQNELTILEEESSSLDRTLLECVSGAIIVDRKNTINFGLAKIIVRLWSMSYRADEGLLPADETSVPAEWITVSAHTTLRQLMKEYGDRLLGYDAKRDEFAVELMSWDLVDTSSKRVRVLVRK